MSLSTKAIDLAAFLALSGGAAYAADAAMKMDCCKDCCDKMKSQEAPPAQPK